MHDLAHHFYHPDYILNTKQAQADLRCLDFSLKGNSVVFPSDIKISLNIFYVLIYDSKFENYYLEYQLRM